MEALRPSYVQATILRVLIMSSLGLEICRENTVPFSSQHRYVKNFSRRLLPTWTASISKGEVKKGSKITSAIAIDYLTISCVLEHDQEITFSSIANPRNIFEISNSRKLLLILCVRGISLPLSG